MMMYMKENTNSNKTIAKNTIFLYVRMLLMMAVSLFTSRITLQALGVSDFGIYNVVGGVVAMFAFLTNSLSNSTNRFITYALGRGDHKELNNTFCQSVNVHVLLSLLFLILAETVGSWFVYNKLVVPADRFDAALLVYHLSIITSIMSILSVPYNATIIAHEKMSTYAYISIIEVLLRLAIVVALLYTSNDKLILIGLLYMFSRIIVNCIYIVYCRVNFKETKYKYSVDIRKLRELLSFAGWSLWGNMASTIMNSGINLMLNVFFGPVVNAARAITEQVRGAVYNFCINFQTAVVPQITKSYAEENYERTKLLVYKSSKYSYLLMLLFILPICIKAYHILHFWLGIVPDHTVAFLRLTLLNVLLDSLAGPLSTANAATGKIRNFQIAMSIPSMVILPISYMCLSLGFKPESVFVLIVIFGAISLLARFELLTRQIGFSYTEYIKNVLLPIILTTVISSAVAIFVNSLMNDTFVSTVVFIIFSLVIVFITTYLFSLNAAERCYINNKVIDFFNSRRRVIDSY